MPFSGDTIWLDEIKFNGTKYKKGVKFNGKYYSKLKFNGHISELKFVRWATAIGVTRTNKYDSSKEADILKMYVPPHNTGYHTLAEIHGVTELIPCIVRDNNIYELEWGNKKITKNDQWVQDNSGNIFFKWQSDNKLYWQNNTGNSYDLGILIKERDK